MAIYIHCLTVEPAGKVFKVQAHPFGQDLEFVLFETTADLGVGQPPQFRV